MAVIPQPPSAVERVWGRCHLPAPFERFGGAGERIGELWFENEDGAVSELLVKFLFTSERLSIQVHPHEDAARARGFPRGKDEAWLVLAAEPGATIGLGLTREASRSELREAALDGSIEQLVDWRPVRAGDFFYSPAGTVHAIGAGLTLLEVQQNVDLTYRLYDYGRPRELHLDEAVEVADPSPWSSSGEPRKLSDRRTVLASGGAFVVERWTLTGSRTVDAEGAPVLLIPLTGAAQLDAETAIAGSVWSADGKIEIAAPNEAEILVAYAGGAVRESLWP